MDGHRLRIEMGLLAFAALLVGALLVFVFLTTLGEAPSDMDATAPSTETDARADRALVRRPGGAGKPVPAPLIPDGVVATSSATPTRFVQIQLHDDEGPAIAGAEIHWRWFGPAPPSHDDWDWEEGGHIEGPFWPEGVEGSGVTRTDQGGEARIPAREGHLVLFARGESWEAQEGWIPSPPPRAGAHLELSVTRQEVLLLAVERADGRPASGIPIGMTATDELGDMDDVDPWETIRFTDVAGHVRFPHPHFDRAPPAPDEEEELPYAPEDRLFFGPAFPCASFEPCVASPETRDRIGATLTLPAFGHVSLLRHPKDRDAPRSADSLGEIGVTLGEGVFPSRMSEDPEGRIDIGPVGCGLSLEVEIYLDGDEHGPLHFPGPVRDGERIHHTLPPRPFRHRIVGRVEGRTGAPLFLGFAADDTENDFPFVRLKTAEDGSFALDLPASLVNAYRFAADLGDESYWWVFECDRPQEPWWSAHRRAGRRLEIEPIAETTTTLASDLGVLELEDLPRIAHGVVRDVVGMPIPHACIRWVPQRPYRPYDSSVDSSREGDGEIELWTDSLGAFDFRRAAWRHRNQGHLRFWAPGRERLDIRVPKDPESPLDIRLLPARSLRVSLLTGLDQTPGVELILEARNPARVERPRRTRIDYRKTSLALDHLPPGRTEIEIFMTADWHLGEPISLHRRVIELDADSELEIDLRAETRVRELVLRSPNQKRIRAAFRTTSRDGSHAAGASLPADESGRIRFPDRLAHRAGFLTVSGHRGVWLPRGLDAGTLEVVPTRPRFLRLTLGVPDHRLAPMMTIEAAPSAPGNRQRLHLDYPISNETAFRPNAPGLWTFSLRAVGSIRIIAEGEARVDCLDSNADIEVTLRAPRR